MRKMVEWIAITKEPNKNPILSLYDSSHEDAFCCELKKETIEFIINSLQQFNLNNGIVGGMSVDSDIVSDDGIHLGGG